jgi:hypothetical protein
MAVLLDKVWSLGRDISTKECLLIANRELAGLGFT